MDYLMVIASVFLVPLNLQEKKSHCLRRYLLAIEAVLAINLNIRTIS